MARRPIEAETVFVKRDGSTMTIRLSDNTYYAAYRAAVTLGARFFITAIERDDMRGTNPWMIIDTDKVQKNNPGPGDITVPPPTKVFEADCLDAAVVYAVALLGRR